VRPILRARTNGVATVARTATVVEAVPVVDAVFVRTRTTVASEPATPVQSPARRAIVSLLWRA
jgi:hypothetical protein